MLRIFANPRSSYIFDKTLVFLLFVVYVVIMTKKEKSIEMLKILGLIE